jgi:hypothetical protein
MPLSQMRDMMFRTGDDSADVCSCIDKAAKQRCFGGCRIVASATNVAEMSRSLWNPICCRDLAWPQPHILH